MEHTKLTLTIDGQAAGEFVILQQINDVCEGLETFGWYPMRNTGIVFDAVYSRDYAVASLKAVKK